jgi:hypothetical protein
MYSPYSQDGKYVVNSGQTVGLFTGLLLLHGLLVRCIHGYDGIDISSGLVRSELHEDEEPRSASDKFCVRQSRDNFP